MEPKDSILARMYVVLTLLAVAPLLIVGQILRIHMAEGAELREQGERQASSFVSIPAVRGAIFDRQGRILAVNTARYDLALDPTIEGFDEVADSFFERLSKLTGTSAGSFRRRVRRRASPQYVELVRGINEREKEEIESWDIPGLILDPTFARRYNYGSAAAHVLGYVSPEGTGLDGLELQYDEVLRGGDGRQAVKRDRLGRIKAYVDGQVVQPKHGESLVLTIDLVRQTILEDELARGVEETRAKSGSAVALDPYTGAVLAMANVPTYDANRPAASPADARRNRAITDRLEPGSTFKLVTAIAAIEQQVVHMEDSIETGDGWVVLHGRTLNDTHAHGTIPFREVIAVSSNVGTAQVATRLEPGTFYQYARNLGFGQPTWIDLPGEVPGRLKRPSEWSGTSLTSMSIGYEVEVTPLQLATAYAALANGGLLVRPHLVAERRDVTNRTVWSMSQDSVRRAFKRVTAETILPGFREVVDDGTAKLAKVEGLPIAGKTGTARKVSGGSYRSGAYRASFVGFFPADDPKVVLAVVLDEPQTSRYGGSAAGPVFQRTAERWIPTFPEIAQRVAPPDTLPPAPKTEVPDVDGLPSHVASRKLIASGYRPIGDRGPTGFFGRSHRYRSSADFGGSSPRAEESSLQRTVADQDPAAHERTVPSLPVRLTTTDADSAAVMIDLRGWSARDAVLWLRAHGSEPQVAGSGTVEDQSAAPGEPLPASVRLTCR